ncbi:GNAT family N-acetyltransferase [Kitasatospora sp. NBC_01250]|uniref:GNAT family N-acetyltransferase n=1 Tax=unclassified Kitasatospora TaxID=2633591 RepID=UPI002E1267AD|nr:MULTISPECIES: GNAT family N-acetyltransferase [unclassified Kitasatospora]WSJ65314.1 GNAT family N-acetyltransferase [Kitasatospora sp. NBC_01302]
MSTPRPAADIREVPEGHLGRALDLASLVFHESYDTEQRDRYRKLLRRCDRLGAYADGQVVGLLAAHRLRLSVPGGQLPCAGLTFVCVAPTHRRRGVLSAMLAQLWRDCAAQGRPLAALWASEAAIYGRHGFGAATHLTTLEIDSTRPLALRLTPDPGPLRLLDAAEAPGLLGPHYEASRSRRAGRPARDRLWWREQVLPEEDEDDDELGPPRIVVSGREPYAGYAIYRTRGGDEDNGTPGLVEVHELESDSAAVAAALWSYLAGLDLTGRVRAWGRPADDVLPLISADRDQVRITRQFPALWLRLVDVRAALTARDWAAPVDLVLEVRDEAVPANHGRFRLTAGPAGAAGAVRDGNRYEPTTDPADLVLDVRDLAACYLGDTGLHPLVRAGLVTERTPGAARRLDAALRTELLPFTHDEF